MAASGRFRCMVMAAMIFLAPAAQAAQTEPTLWNWAAGHYGIEAPFDQNDSESGVRQKPPEVLLPYWDAWLMRPPGTEAEVQPVPAPLPTSLSAKAWIYISKAQQTLYIKDGEQTLAQWPVSTARYSLSTPVGRFRITEKVADPPYSGRHGYFKAHDPRNPLGTRWVGLNVGHFRTGVPIGIHGTIEPDKIGSAVSDGCIRLRNADVELLFKLIKVGTPVVISNQ